MVLLVFLLGLVIGYFLHHLMQKILKAMSYHKSETDYNPSEKTIMFLTAALVTISFLKFGMSAVLLKAVILDCILIIASFIDIKYQLIPDKLVLVAIITGNSFLAIGDMSLKNAVFGMTAGGLTMFILALVPGTIGGGDIKLMFALGAFLGLRKILIALVLSFICASIVSILLLIFKIKGRKDYIPFAPFIALASFISYHLHII